MRDIGKRAVSVVVEKNVVSPETTKQVVPSIVVVIADADSRLPTRAAQARLLRDIGKRAIAVVLVEMRSRRLPGRPMGIEPIPIRKVDVQPAVVVVVEESQSAALGLNDGAFVIDASPHVGDGQPGLLSHIHILDRETLWDSILRLRPVPGLSTSREES